MDLRQQRISQCGAAAARGASSINCCRFNRSPQAGQCSHSCGRAPQSSINGGGFGHGLEEVGRGVDGPVQVVQQRHQALGLRTGSAPQQFTGQMKGAATDLPCVDQDPGHVRTGGEVQPDEVPDQRRRLVGLRTGGRRQALLQLGLLVALTVALGDVEEAAEQASNATRRMSGQW